MLSDARPLDHETLGRMIEAVQRSGANVADWAISAEEELDGVWGHLEIYDPLILSRLVAELVALGLAIDIDIEICPSGGAPPARWGVNLRVGTLRAPAPPTPGA
jgi:hypothetical protein